MVLFPQEIWRIILQYKYEIEIREKTLDSLTPNYCKRIDQLRQVTIRTKGGYAARLEPLGKWAQEHWERYRFTIAYPLTYYRILKYPYLYPCLITRVLLFKLQLNRINERNLSPTEETALHI